MSAVHVSVEALQARYNAERDKRLRADTVSQYRDLGEVFADIDRDPYTPRSERDPIKQQVEVAVIGAGLGGLSAAARLVEQGITDIRIIDKAGDFGGTWYWNRYPGAACDTESYIYLPLLEETGYVPTEKYAKAPEIFAHCQRIGRHFDLYSKALFQTEVSDLSWSDATSRWTVTTDRGDTLSARFVVIAGGILHVAKLPGIPGIDTFKGHAFHSSRWDYTYTGGSPTTPMDKLAGKRVALVGTGATSIQILPRLAEAAGDVVVIQRTPSGVGVRANRATDPEWAGTLQPGWQRERIENFTRVVSSKPVEQDLVADGWTEIFLRNPAAMSVMDEEQLRLDAIGMEAIRDRIDTIIGDQATAEALKPWYNQLCKRPCFHDEYLAAYNRPNVHLVDTAGRGVDRITETGLVVDGVEYEVDCIIYASGFETSSTHLRQLGFEIHGRNGVSLTHAWAEGAATLHGVHAHGFPNLFRFSMLQGGIAINFAHILGELAEHAAWIIRHCHDEGIVEIEATEQGQSAWFQTLLANMSSLGMFYAQCTPSYMNGEGSKAASAAAMRSIPFFGGTLEYIEILRAWRAAGALDGLEAKRETSAGGSEGAVTRGGSADVGRPDGMSTVFGSLAGRVVVVTGAAGGIGAGIAKAIAEAGGTVVVVDIDDAGAARHAASLTDAGYAGGSIRIDVGDEASIVEGCRRIVEEYGAPWALINNAGVQDRQLLLEAEAGEWDRVLRINSRGPFLMTREIAKAMVISRMGGRIVNIASSGVKGQLVRGHAAYASSKTALLGLTRVSAMELAEHGITVNTLLPGGVITTGAVSSKGPPFDGPALRPPPLGMCEPRDIAAAAVFLSSPAARFITNQTLSVDAGWGIS
ncbi:NAD(P)/FAD-dependent oxidoreductase [Sphingomonas solaris]|uniref:SDR family oxidoreductase n=1 Tax=Alterirhizorhabdus solaris TaxID=2529389 RepID=A0A558R9C4_9SPHN|nr:NAD(P)/FAD-dependent oxidoreductase [Sphingomonas solaris]TVV75948.1 SDR family oxidoreductase [Sphingomonas solaris]